GGQAGDGRGDGEGDGSEEREAVHDRLPGDAQRQRAAADERQVDRRPVRARESDPAYGIVRGREGTAVGRDTDGRARAVAQGEGDGRNRHAVRDANRRVRGRMRRAGTPAVDGWERSPGRASPIRRRRLLAVALLAAAASTSVGVRATTAAPPAWCGTPAAVDQADSASAFQIQSSTRSRPTRRVASRSVSPRSCPTPPQSTPGGGRRTRAGRSASTSSPSLATGASVAST